MPGTMRVLCLGTWVRPLGTERDQCCREGVRLGAPAPAEVGLVARWLEQALEGLRQIDVELEGLVLCLYLYLHQLLYSIVLAREPSGLMKLTLILMLLGASAASASLKAPRCLPRSTSAARLS